MAYYIKEHFEKPLIVITTAKKRDSLDWEEEAIAFGISRHYETTMGGVIIVDSWNNIANYKDVKNAFFIFDEQRLVGSGAWVRSFLKIAKENDWILLSATPGDTWIDYIPVFRANGFYKNQTEFVHRHVQYEPFSKYPKIRAYTDVGHLVRLRNSILVHMPYERHTTRHGHNVWCEYDTKLMDTVYKKRWDPYLNEPIADMGGVFRLMRRVAASHESRPQAIADLLNKHPRLIVFYSFDYELEVLREVGRTLRAEQGVHTAEWNGHLHQEVPDAPRWLYLVNYAAGAEGWNCTSTNAVCFFSLTYSYKTWEQCHGRIDRLNTPFDDLHYYALRSKAMIDTAIWRALSEKRNFNERDLVFE
jgi:hypothetical protein